MYFNTLVKILMYSNFSVMGGSLYPNFPVEKVKLADNQKELFIITKSDNVKAFALAKIFVENNKIVHESLGSFYNLNGANKEYSISLGCEWNGGQTFDDLAD